MLNNKKLIALLIGSIVIISMLFFTINNGNHNILTSAVNETGSWIGRTFSAPVNVVVNFVDSVDELINTYHENQHLKRKIGEIDELQVRIVDLETENEKMRQELELTEVLGDFDVVHATVIARNPDQWMETLTINVGLNQGLRENMAVMAGNGLIGRVIEVNPSSAKVMLLTTQQQNESKVAARIQTKEDSSANGIISSYDRRSGNYIMTQVDPSAQISPGDMVITSGLGGVIPSQLLIGEVAETYMDDYGLFRVVEVEPAGEMTDIRFVTVIKREGRSE